LGVVLTLAAIATYANSLDTAFTFDDDAAIVDNASIRSLGTALSPPERGEPVAGRPVVNLSFALNYAAGGLDVRGYHAVNVALHIACALLLFALIRETLKRRWADLQGPPAQMAFACTLLWLVHPLNSEAINYISQRTELLMAFFYLLTLYASARGWLALAVAACAAGMACKETMATAPIVVLLYDRTFLFGSFKDAIRARRTFYAALAATWGLLAALIWSGPRWESAGFSTGITPWNYLLNQAVILVEYLKRVFWPRSLVLDYGEPVAYTPADVAPQAVIVVALLAATVWALAKRPAMGFLAASFFIILAPTSSVIPIATEVGAERRMYLSLAALIVLVVVGVRRAVRPAGRNGPRYAGNLVVATSAILLAAATIQRNTEYHDGLTLWQTTLERWPSARAHRNVATELKRAGRGEEALAHLRQTLTDHPEARYALGFELFEQGKHGEAVEELSRFVRELPADQMVPMAHTVMGNALVKQEKYAEAAEHFQVAADRRPDVAQNWITLGVVLAQSEQMDRAEAALRKGVGMAPRNSGGQMVLGLVLAARGQLDEGASRLRMAIELDPANGEAREHLAQIEQLRRRS
jgi:Flp pilus assembly protein TadD